MIPSVSAWSCSFPSWASLHVSFFFFISVTFCHHYHFSLSVDHSLGLMVPKEAHATMLTVTICCTTSMQYLQCYCSDVFDILYFWLLAVIFSPLLIIMPFFFFFFGCLCHLWCSGLQRNITRQEQCGSKIFFIILQYTETESLCLIAFKSLVG